MSHASTFISVINRELYKLYLLGHQWVKINYLQMKKEIGSIFPLSDEILQKAESEKAFFINDRLYYSLCREALYNIAFSLEESNKNVLIPAYTCNTVITPFEEAGWKCNFFSIKKDLRIDTQNLCKSIELHKPSLLLLHPYFGMDLNKEEVQILQFIRNNNVKIVIDLTQCIFSAEQYSFASFIVASYRKWMPIPDGGYLLNVSDSVHIKQPETENKEFTENKIAAMYLRGMYFGNGEQRTKDISIRLNKLAEHYVDSHIIPHKMSLVAYNLLNSEDKDYNQASRFVNYSYLYKNIKENIRVTKVCKNIKDLTTAPLYFTLYVQNRLELRKLLAQNSVYAPDIWPVEDNRVLINDDVRYIYDHLLAIPCDQRYDENDMQRVVEIINQF